MRRLGEADRAAVEAFLLARAETSMFPLSNLLRHGMEGAHPRAMRFWGWGDPLEAVLGVTEEGMVLPQLPPASAGEGAEALRGRRVMGFAGEAGQIAALRAAMGLGGAPARLDEEEGLFTLNLAGLRMPKAAGLALAPLSAAPRRLLVAWNLANGREALGWREDDAGRAEEDLDRMVGAGQHRVLLREGEPVALASFKARVPGIVQVGGVWTPPEGRRRGFARAAVALHLAEARGEGVGRAILFTANPFAARACRALGFGEVGRFALVLLDGAQGAA